MKATPKDRSRVSDAVRRNADYHDLSGYQESAKTHTSLRIEEAKERIHLGLSTIFSHGKIEGKVFSMDIDHLTIGRDELGAIATTVNTLERVRDLQFAGQYKRRFNGNQLVSVSCPSHKIAEICKKFNVEMPAHLQKNAPNPIISM